MGRHKLIAGGIRRFEDYKKYVFYNYGIDVYQGGRYKGFILEDIEYDIWIPIINTDGDFSLRHDYEDHFHVRTFPEVIQKINRIYRLDPERFEKLREGMTGLRSR